MRHFKEIRLFAIAVLGILPFMAAPAHASTPSEVTAAADGADANEARTLAITNGQIQALNAIAQQQLNAQQAERVKNSVTPQQVSDAVEGFEVLNEKITTNHYEAKFRFTFNDDKLVALFQGAIQAGAPIAEPLAQPVLVLPVQKQDGAVLLWEETNAWRDAWNHITPPNNSSNLRIPLGDLGDMQTANAKTVLSADCTRLSVLAKRYNAEHVLIAVAENTGTPEAPAIKVTMQHTCGPDGAQPATSKQYNAQSTGETDRMVYYQAARDIAAHFKVRAVSGGLKTPEQGVQTITMLAPIRSANDWVTLRNRIRSLTSVSRVDLVAISGTQADLMVNYKGKPAELQQAMEQIGLRVSPADKYWAVYVR